MPFDSRREKSSWWALLGVTLLALAGCAGDREAELLEVRQLSPSRVEPGRTLRIRGAGFPPGRQARVRLEGTLHRPGAHPIEARAELEGRATSSERVEARFDRAMLEALGGRGSLHGRVTVLFDTAEGRGAVVGHSPDLVIDISPATTDRVGEELARARLGAELAERAGLALGDEPPDVEGLPIEVVMDGSSAARAGLLAGDRVVELAGVRTHSLADLVAPPGVDEVELRVAREGESAPFTVDLPLGEARDGLRPETLRAAQVALAWVLLILLVLAPSAGVADWLARRARATRSLAPAPVSGGRVRRWLRRHARSLPWTGLGIAALGALPALHHAGWLRVPLEALTLAVLAVRASAAWMASPPETGWWKRTLEVLHGVAGTAMFAVGVVCVAAMGGTTDLGALVDQQGILPWSWTLARSPLGPIVLGLFLAGASTAPEPLARAQTSSARIARRLDDVVLLAVAGTAASVLLGGWSAGADADGLTRLVGASSFLAQSLILWMWSRRARRLAHATRAAFAAHLGLVVAVVLGTGVRIAWDPPEGLEPALGRVVGAAALLLACIVAGRLWAGRVRHAPVASHPFL